MLEAVGARASGWWRIDRSDARNPRLVLLAFAGARDLPFETAVAFTEATAEVPLDRPELGIVRAALGDSPAISTAETRETAPGSSHWLEAFGASRSIAVPIRDHPSGSEFVVSVAIPARSDRPSEELADDVRRWAREPIV